MGVAELDGSQSGEQEALQRVLRLFSITHNAQQGSIIPWLQLICPRAAATRGVHFEYGRREVRGQDIIETLACGELEGPVQLLELEQRARPELFAGESSGLYECTTLLAVGLCQRIGQCISPRPSCLGCPNQRWLDLTLRECSIAPNIEQARRVALFFV